MIYYVLIFPEMIYNTRYKCRQKEVRNVIILNGRTVCGGIAIGKAMLYRREDSLITRYHIDSIEAEIERFERARKQAIEELGTLYSRAVNDVGKASAEIFSIHQQMLDDPDYVESVKNIIQN